MIAVIQAHKDGKAAIECKSKSRDVATWVPMWHWPFNFEGLDYRIKPEPRKPRECNSKDIIKVREVLDDQ